jgi:hypothetical protein
MAAFKVDLSVSPETATGNFGSIASCGFIVRLYRSNRAEKLDIWTFVRQESAVKMVLTPSHGQVFA